MRRHRYTESPEAYTEPLTKRLGRFVALMGTVFAIAVAVIVTQRLSRDSLALLIGLSCGVMAMMPTMALGIFIWRREEARRQERGQQQVAQPASPPVIVVTPQGLPNYNQMPSLNSQDVWAPSGGQRSFRIVGESD